MKKEEIHLWDWQRLLIGNNPWEFMIEVLLRTLLIYILLIVVLRLLGKRMSAQLSISEMSVMITLGAIIAVPMQLAERGILPAVVVLFCALFFQRGLNWLAFKYEKIEHFTHGQMSLLIEDGYLLLKEMKKERASREQIFAVLRTKNIQHLGQVKRLYLEANGAFSVYKNEEPKPGLSVLPQQDQDLLAYQSKSSQYVACHNCGNTVKRTSKLVKGCHRCGAHCWVQAFETVPANQNEFALQEDSE